MRILLVLVGMFALFGCASESPTYPNIEGTWAGTEGGAGNEGITMQLVLHQSDASVSGTFSEVYKGKAINGGIASGTMQRDGSVFFALKPGNSGVCTMGVDVKLTAGALVGSFYGYQCVGTIVGTLHLTRE